MGNTKSSLSVKKTKEIKLGNDKILIVTNNYIISESKMLILNIFDIHKNLFQKINYDSSDYIIKFHPTFENVFLLADKNIIKIFEIKKEEFKLKERITASGHTQHIKIAEFSKTNEEIFATYSADKTIKVWKMSKPFCIYNIPLCNLITVIQIYNNYIYYFDETKSTIIKCNYDKFKTEKIVKVDAMKFIVITEEKSLLILSDQIQFINLNSGEKSNKKKLNGLYTQIFYDENFELLYIFYLDSFDIIDINTINIIHKQKVNNLMNNAFFSNQLNQAKLYVNFFLICFGKIQIYSLYSKNNSGSKKYKIPLIPDQNFWDKTVPNISDIANLGWKANIEEDIVKCKEYLNTKIIKDEIDINYKKSLNIKKLEVDTEVEKLKPKKIGDLDYISILKLLIKDNTNKELIGIYLQYLKYLKDGKKVIKIENNDMDGFDEEYKNYEIMLTNDDLKQKELEGKVKVFSEKEKFMQLLQKINNFNYNNKNELDSFKNDVDNKLKTLQLFNQPINLSNKELYWYRNTFVLYFSLKELLNKEEKLNLMKAAITTILDKNILNKEYIVNNAQLLTSIIILIAKPQSSNNFKFNLNLIEAMDPNYNYENEEDFKKMKKCTQKDIIGYFFNYDNYNHFLNNPSSSGICFNNFILNIKQNMRLEDFEKKTYDKIKEHFNELIDFVRMKKFLAKIFCSNVFKQAFKILYPDNYIFPFKDENDAYEFLEKYYHFIPFRSDATGAITEKFSLEIYYLLKNRMVHISGNNSKVNDTLVRKIFYRGSCVKSSCHEINHEFYNIFLMHSNGLIPIETPRKIFINEREGGKNLEMLLFNQKIGKLSLKECIYLLNEKNYEKSLQDFKKGFNELNDKDLKLDNNSFYSEFKIIVESESFSELGANSFIKCDEDGNNSNLFSNSYIDDIEDVNDVLGFIRDLNKL